MAFNKSPGINVSEIDLTAVTPAVGTTEAGIAGHFVWGPVDQRTLITSEDELVKTYGKPNANTADDFFTAANFLSYGNRLYVSRVVNTGDASDANKGRNAISAAANGQVTLIKNSDDYEDNYSSGITGVGNWVAKYPGKLGNSLRVAVCPSSNAFSNTITGNVAITSNTATLTGFDTDFTNELQAGDILIIGPARTEVKIASVGSANSATLTAVYTGNTVTMHDATDLSVTPTRKWEFFRNFNKAPGTSAYAAARGGSGDEMHIVVVDEDGEWSGSANSVLESFEAVSQASDAKTESGSTNYYKNVLNQQSEYVWWTAHNSTISQAGSTADSTTFTTTNGAPFSDSLVLGSDGVLPTNGDYLDGYDLFDNSEEVDISFVLGSAANQTRATDLINNVAEARTDCIAVLSPEKADVVDNAGYPGKQADDSVTFRNLLPSSSYAVMDSGWKYQYDRYNDVYRWVPLNGDTAGIMARSDSQRDPWYSPAGFNRGQVKNVIKLAYSPRKADRETLYNAGINPVVTFPGQGTVLFGDKTMLAQASAFDRINVRRLFIVLEKVISQAARQSLFEFNDEFTRAQFVNLVEPFLREVQGRRGVTDFRVICDETNNTAEVIDRNEFVGDIFVKPNRSINFIQLNFVAVRTGVEFTEVVGAV
jgi:phage tail sheath protein FI